MKYLLLIYDNPQWHGTPDASTPDASTTDVSTTDVSTTDAATPDTRADADSHAPADARSPANIPPPADTDSDAAVRGHYDFNRRITESGECVVSAALADPSESTSVSVRDGVVATTDGPFVESKEHLAGFYLVECDSLERAVELAAQIPDAHSTAIEIRPVIDPFVGLDA